MPKIKKLMINICLSIAIFIIMLIFFEIFLIMFPVFSTNYSYPAGLFQNEEAPLDYSMVPNFIGRSISPDFDVKIKINSRGLLDYEHDLQSDNFRILALGDSFAFGHGVELEENFLSIIENKLGIEVIKMGVPGYAQDQQLEFYKKRGKDYDHNTVLLFYYMDDNDGNEGTKDKKVSFGSLILKKKYNSLPTWKLYVYSKLYQSKVARLVDRMIRELRFYDDVSTKTNLIEDRIYQVSQSKDNQDWKKTYELIEELKKTVYPNELIVIYLPSQGQIDMKKLHDFDNSLFDIDKPNKILGEIAKDLDLPYIDVTKKIREFNFTGMHLGKYDGHFNALGSRLYGVLVTHELKKHLNEKD